MIHRLLSLTWLLAALTSPAWGQATHATEQVGVRYEATMTVAGTPLQLNGAGIRFKAGLFKVYTAGLYLAGRANSPEAVLSMPGPKRLQVVMLREIDSNELGKLFVRGMQDNAPRDEFARSIPGTIRMGEIFAAKRRLLAGEHFSIDWVPGTGTLVRINGKPAAEAIAEPEFFQALLRIWLGKSPADALLKDALLGKPPTARQTEN